MLNSIVDKPARAARIGGDEFAVILPNVEQAEGMAMMKVIRDLVAINNEFYTDLPLSLSMGLATSEPGERLEAVVKRADLAMLKPPSASTTRRRGTKTGACWRRRNGTAAVPRGLNGYASSYAFAQHPFIVAAAILAKSRSCIDGRAGRR